MPIAEKPHIEKILYNRIAKKMRRNIYLEYMVKWKDHPIEYASFVIEEDIQKHGKTVQELMERSP
jgi:hypothetical protein